MSVVTAFEVHKVGRLWFLYRFGAPLGFQRSEAAALRRLESYAAGERPILGPGASTSAPGPLSRFSPERSAP